MNKFVNREINMDILYHIYINTPGKPKTPNFLVILGTCRNDKFFW